MILPEILESIFLYLPRFNSFLDIHPKVPSNRDVHSWIKVTHVCRYWRSTALAAKALWRRIVINRRTRSAASLALAFFERSNPLPIELEHGCFAVEGGEMDPFYCALTDNPHRIAVLNLRGGHLHKRAWDLLQRQLLNVVELSLWSGSRPVEERKDLRNVDFLGGQTDTLRKLYLRGYSWPQAPFPALTHLYLKNDFRERRVSPIELFRLLQSASSTLEVLHMQDTSPFFDSPRFYSPPPPDKRIHMLSLRYVEIHQFVHENASLFPLLFLQNLFCPRMERIVWDAEYMYTWAPHEWNSNMLPPTHHLLGVTSLIGQSSQMCYVLTGATLYVDLIPHMSALTVAFLGNYLSNVKLLALPNFPSEPYHLKRNILRAYSSVTSLHLGWYDDLHDILIDLEGHEDVDGEPTAICPNLKTLTIYTGANWRANTHKFRPALKAHRLSTLRLSSSQFTRRKRRRHGTTYTLQFQPGDIGMFFKEDE